MHPKAAEPQPEVQPSVNVEINTANANGQFEIEHNNKQFIIQKQIEEIEHLKSFIQNHSTPQMPSYLPTPTPTQETQSEELYIDVQDVCVYGVKLKHWLIGISILLVTAIIVTVITFKKD